MQTGTRRTNTIAILATVAGILVLATLNYLLLTRPAGIRAIAPSQTKLATEVSTAPSQQRLAPSPLVIDRDAILTRPLFRPDRRPYVPAPVSFPEDAATFVAETGPVAAPADPFPVDVAPEPALLPSGLHLVGILNDKGPPRALLRHDAEPAQWFSQGAEISGWTLQQVGADFVELKAAGQTSTLHLFSAPAKTAGAPEVPIDN